MFYTNKSRLSTNNLNNSNRIKTNMSLTQLVESNQSNQSNQSNNTSRNKNKFNNNNNNNKNNKNKFNNNNNKFYNKPKLIESEFKINIEDFPILQETNQNTTQNTTQNTNQNTNYSEKLKSIKVEQENYKTRISKKPKEYKKKEIQDTIISEYYNPTLSLRILNNRQEYREELNEILGDISPYWNKTSEDELSLLDEEEVLISDNDDEYNNSIIEDW